MQRSKEHSTGAWCAIRLQIVDIVDGKVKIELIVRRDGQVKIELIVSRGGEVKIKRQLNVNTELEENI